MKNACLAKVGNVLRCLLLCKVFALLACGCASSDVSRDVSSNIDVGVEHTRNMIAHSGGEMADTWQNATQPVKGGIIGAAVGGLTGGASAVGFMPGLLVGTLLGTTYGSYIESNETLADRLRNRGVILVTLGDHVLIVLPAARIFHAMTATIKPSAYSTLNLVTRYINGYTSMLVRVSGYTNAVGSESVNRALSTAQANSVANYLSLAGVDTRVLYAMGYGSQHLVQHKSCVWGDSDNYRIEITLEKEYV